MFMKLLPLILQIVGWILVRSGASNDTKAKYFDFLKSIEDDASFSVKLRASAMNQRNRIMEKLNNANPPANP